MLVCSQGESGPFVPWSIKGHSWPSFWFGIRELGSIVFLVINSCEFHHNRQQKNASWFSCRDSLLYWTNTDGWTGSYCYMVGRLYCICCPLGPVTLLIVQKKSIHSAIVCILWYPRLSTYARAVSSFCPQDSETGSKTLFYFILSHISYFSLSYLFIFQDILYMWEESEFFVHFYRANMTKDK